MPDEENSAPVTRRLATETLPVPEFVTVTIWVALVPVAVLPKLTEVGETERSNMDEHELTSSATSSRPIQPRNFLAAITEGSISNRDETLNEYWLDDRSRFGG